MDCHETIICDCGVANIVDLPDPEGDGTGYHGCAPAYKCWNCGKVSWRGDPTNTDWTDGICNWDADLSVEENLVEVDFEEGRPSEDYESAAFEKFLDYDCSIDPAITWRGFFLQRLFFLNGAKDVWAEKRPRRIALVEQLLDASDSVHRNQLAKFNTPLGPFHKRIAKSFNDFADDEDEIKLDCRKYKIGKKGSSKVVGIDWPDYHRTLKEIVHYMMGIK